VFGSYLMTDTEFFKNKYTYDYVFDDAVRTFGVTKSVALDIKYAISGIPIKELAPVDDIDEDPNPTEYAEHKLNIDWEGFWDSIGNNSGLNSAASVVTSTKASQENEYTGLFEGKNLVLITVESFSKELIREDFFPLIYKMANEGIVVEDYYHPFWGGSTTSGETAILTGLIPTDGAKTMQNTLGKNNNYTLAPMLSQRNYSCIAYHNGDYDYYSRYKTHPSLGFSAFYSYGSGMEDWLTDTWPRGDLEMFRFIEEDVKNYDNFYAYIMTFSGHGLYNFTGNEIGKKNRSLLQGTEYYNQKRIGGYIACSMDLELGLEEFVASLEERGVLENTVFVLTTDHYAYALQNGDAWLNDRNYLEDLFGYYPDTQIKRDHNALIIWSPCLAEQENQIVVSDPCSAIDILPTLLNLFGVEYDSRIYAGRDILSDEDPLVIWANSSWLTDKGSYDSTTGVFTPNEGEAIPDNYVQEISDKVRNKMTLSRNFISNDFYKYIEDNIKE